MQQKGIQNVTKQKPLVLCKAVRTTILTVHLHTPYANPNGALKTLCTPT